MINLNLSEDWTVLLPIAIIKLAASDYRLARRVLKKRPGNEAALNLKKECEDFFNDDFIDRLYSIRGKEILKRLENEFDER